MNTDLTKAYITIKNVSKKYLNSGFELNSFNLDIHNNDFISILGPSGSGKSTLLRLISELEPVDEGLIQINSKERFEISYVFQDAHLLPWRSVLKNVELPLELMRVPDVTRTQLATEALNNVGLAHSLQLYPHELSGGMKMRASLARALVTKPKLLLLDEPFAALDEQIRHKLTEDLRQLWLDQNLTIVFVTHSVQEACFLSNRVLILNGNPTTIKADLKIQLPLTRTTHLRTETEFNDQLKLIYKAINENTAND